MIRNSKFYFSFNGKTSTEMGVEILSAPVRYHPQENGKQLTVSGRHGFLWQSDNSYKHYAVSIECCCGDNANLDEVMAWLSGAGQLIFSDEPDRMYKARILSAYSRANIKSRFANQKFTVSWQVQPFRYLFPEAEAFTITQSGSSFPVLGTVESEPKITIRGNGSFILVIGKQLMSFTDIVDGIVVDSELMDALSLDEASLLNNNVDGDFFTLQPGMGVCSWRCDSGANVSSVTILPRWRFL